MMTVAVAAGLVALSLPSGSYGVAPRAIAGILVWAAAIGVIAFTSGGRPPVPSAAVVVVAGLAGLLALTGLSIAWAPSAERAFSDLDLVSLYLGLFVLVVVSVRRSGGAAAVLDGLALGIAAVAALALASRCFGHLISGDRLASLLPSAQTRLSYPLQYWNGLGILAGIGLAPALGAALRERAGRFAGLWLGAVPVLAATIYLTSSRGGAIVAAVAVVAFVACAAARVQAVCAVAAGAATAAAAIAVLQSRPALVDGPLRSAAAISQGHSAAALLVLVCAIAAALGLLTAAASLRARRLARPVAQALAALAVLGALTGVAIAGPAQRWQDFKRPPTQFLRPTSDFVRAHLLSGGGSGRWQFWSTAWHAFERAPLAGHGAGSFEPWWAQHAPITYFVRNAHSLYLETLAELGLLGGLALAAALAAGLVVGTRRVRGSPSAQRGAVAALLAAYVAFLVGAGVDWIWQLPAVGAVGITCLALLTGPATAGEEGGGRTWRPGFGAGVLAVGAAWLLICAQALPWLVQSEVRASRAAVRAGDLARARARGQDARALAPWASSPYVQLALVAERARDTAQARVQIRRALARDDRDWRLWLIAARLNAESGATGPSRASLARARALNPRSPLLRSLAPAGRRR